MGFLTLIERGMLTGVVLLYLLFIVTVVYGWVTRWVESENSLRELLPNRSQTRSGVVALVLSLVGVVVVTLVGTVVYLLFTTVLDLATGVIG